MSEEKKSAARKTGPRRKNGPDSAAKAGRKSAAGKSAPGKSKSKKRARKARKPKVVLSTKKVITFCAFVCCLCALFLGLSVVLNSMPEKNQQNNELAAEKTSDDSAHLPEKKKATPEKNDLHEKKVPQGKPSPDSSSGKKAVPSQEKSQNSVLPERPLNSEQKSSSRQDGTVKKSSENPVRPQAQEKSLPVNSSSGSKNPVQKKPGNSLAENVQEKSSAVSSGNSSASSKSSVQKSVPARSPAKASAPQKPAPAQKKASAAVPSSPAPSKASAQKNEPSAASVKKTEKPAAAQKSPEKKSPYVASSANQKQNENAQSQALKNPRFDIPKAVNGATVVIVIDDAGLSVENVKKYASLPFPLTIAVLPRLEHSRECAQTSISLGKEVILHQPMQSVNHRLDPGPGKITVDMGFSEIADVIAKNLSSLGPGVKGMNNHEGSEVTGDVIRIGAVLDACQSHGIYFLDSRTTAATKAPQAALERDMKIYEKAGPYLDNELAREKMLERMYETLRYANNHGHALVIGHVDKSVKILPDLLAEMYPYMKAAGYKFATPSTLR